MLNVKCENVKFVFQLYISIKMEKYLIFFVDVIVVIAVSIALFIVLLKFIQLFGYPAASLINSVCFYVY